MKNILLDTNAYSNLLRGNISVYEKLNEAEKIVFSPIVLGELYAGFKEGVKEKENRQILNRFLEKSKVNLIEFTRETFEIFAEIKVKLKKAGKPLPINDVWIAAQAIESSAVLITFDHHFLSIPYLRTWELS